MLKDNLRRLMEAQGLTPEALAVRMQTSNVPVTYAAVRGWLSGTRTPNFANLRALASALKCSLDILCADATPKAGRK